MMLSSLGTCYIDGGLMVTKQELAAWHQATMGVPAWEQQPAASSSLQH